ncbi:ATP-dependent DNA helicase RecG [Staphylococcus ursi]|uniref:RNA-binding domain-containing protein n=1 Tax=Staphylococcus sp. MI 10-1553 TaxID=1912064 RepID=UPI0013986346|nr:RNA-binding domain-containing protein [Staphylococcus sp. MI 10-1553]QHW38228.1 ATP-dependent DNA helicase RecG [Staphylococcus sp. MI 10-1553]
MRQELKREGIEIEYKKSEDKLPKSFWETYSSFSNSKGGYIYLGISEEKEALKITGVKNIDKILKDLTNQANDRDYTNYNNIKEDNIRILKDGEVEYVEVYIPEAPTFSKPVHVRGNINNSFIRRNDSDQKMTGEEIRRYLRDANPNNDAELIDFFNIEHLDVKTIRKYKELIQDRNEELNILEMDNWEFLKKYGAIGMDKNTGEYKLKKGALLFFGKEESILALYPNYHLDYRNRIQETLDTRWIDRVSSGELNNIELNLFNFYNVVLEKLVNTVLENFQLNEDTKRRESAKRDVEISLREALANALIHADYEDNVTIKIEAFKNHYVFSNPGEMLVTKEEFARGGETKARNTTIVTLFRKAGYSERAGSGGMKIFQVATQNKFRMPEVQSNEGKTILKIWKIDLIDSYVDLSKEEKTIISYIEKNGLVTMKELQSLEGLTEHIAKTRIKKLIEKRIVSKYGDSRSTRYGIQRDGSELIASLEHDIRNMQNYIVDKSK